jgi:hypothetical protein
VLLEPVVDRLDDGLFGGAVGTCSEPGQGVGELEV